MNDGSDVGMTGQLVLPGAAVLELPPVAVPIPAVERLLAVLIAGGTDTICNFYAGADTGAGIRRERLRRYLTARWAAGVVLVGEAAGYRGACRSGIPFTSERQLTGAGFAEPSATIVHRVLGELDLEGQVMLWNAVPYHPHAARHDSNRPPTRGEVAACQELLAAVCAGRRAIAVGRVAAAALGKALDDDVAAVRHPAHGGAREFAEGLRRLLASKEAAGCR
jgi:uracil-DNA glycosylase